MMMFFKLLKSVWLWLQNIVVYFRPRISSPNHDHDSDTTSSNEEERICRVPCDSSTRIIDGVDHVPIGPRRSHPNLRDVTHYVPKRNLRLRARGEAVQLKNPYCVVIVNIFYENRIGPRNGAQADLENIERLLRHSAGFKTVYVYADLTRGKILEIMERVSNSPEIGNHDGLVVFISSHGKARGILAVDKEIVKVDELTSRVNGKQCKSLRGKPKIFFISACRGKKTDPGVPGPVTADASEDEKLVPKLPTDADFLVCYSTTEGNISYRRFGLEIHNTPDMGTWLISSVTQVFEEKMKDEDIMQMLARVNARVANRSSNGDHEDGMKQMPVQMHMLRHRVFFGKG